MTKALCLPGSGCRGAFQAAVLGRLIKAGEHFDMVAGASSGSISGAVFVSGRASEGLDMWRSLANTPVVSRRYLRTEGSIFGMGQILREAVVRFVDVDAVLRSPTELLIATTRIRPLAMAALRHAATRAVTKPPTPALAIPHPESSVIRSLAIQSGALVVHSTREPPLCDHAGASEEDSRKTSGLARLHQLIVASCTIPILGGRVQRIDDELHIDGGAADNTLLGELVRRGATDITIVSPYSQGAVCATLFESEQIPELPSHVRVRRIWPARPLRLKHFEFTPEPLEEALTMPHVEAELGARPGDNADARGAYPAAGTAER